MLRNAVLALTGFKRLFDSRPLHAQLIVTYECNLSCSYCHEFTAGAPLVPLDVLTRRIDALGKLGAFAYDILGGEPLMHPDIVAIVRRVKQQRRGYNFVTLITNAFKLTADLVDGFNDAKLDCLQVSVDTIDPEPGLPKSLRSVLPKLAILAERAQFAVKIQTVLTESSWRRYEDFHELLRPFDFEFSFSLLHDSRGKIGIQGQHFADLLKRHELFPAMGFVRRNAQEMLVGNFSRPWKCLGGSKYVYVNATGHVQYCSQVAGERVPVETMTFADLRAANVHKPCEPGCSVGCVRAVSHAMANPLTNLPVSLEMLGEFMRPRPARTRPATAASLKRMKSAESAGERTRQAVIVCPPEGGDPLRVVGGLALIERGLRQLCDLGIDEIVIVIPQGRPAPRPSARITASVRIVQGQQSGTGQMAGDAAPWITDRCIVTTGDLVVDQRVLRWLCEQPTNVMVRTEDTGGLLAALDRSTLASNDMQSVAAVSLDTFPTYWASMRGDVPVHVLRVATNADAEHAWRVLIDHVDKRAKDLPALLFDPPFENFLVRRLAPTRITPNQITLFTTLLGFFVAWLFWQGWLGLGVALAIVVEVLDGVDGKLARLKRMTSRLGEFEHVLDFFYETSWYVALGHAFSRSVTWGWPAAALICVADLADNLAYIHHRRTTAGANLDEATPWLLRFRLVAGRRNIYMWLLLVGLVLASARAAFAFAAGWAFLTAAVHWQQSLVLARHRKRALESPSREGHVVEEAQRQRAPS